MRSPGVIVSCVIAIGLLLLALAVWWSSPGKAARQTEDVHVEKQAADPLRKLEHEPGEPAPEPKKIARRQPSRPHAVMRRLPASHAKPPRSVQQTGTTTPPADVSRTTYDGAYAFLQSRPSDSGTPVHASRTIKNNLMNELCRRNPAPPGLTDVLVGIYQDHEQDDVIRDYALQHLAAGWYQRVSPPEKGRIEDVLWDALDEKRSSMAGTALLALTRIRVGDNAGAEPKLRAAALQSVSDRSCSVLTRITAAQVCARMDIQEAMPIVCRLARTSPSFALRRAARRAVAALSKEQGTPAADRIRDCECD